MNSRKSFLAGLATAFGLMAILAAGFVIQERGVSAQASGIPHFRAPSIEYGPQKVVYHVASKGTWRDRESEAWRLVAVLNNHINAVQPDTLDVQVIFQGDGIDALKRAKSNTKLGLAFDEVKKRGVKFRICANTLEAYRLGLETLHNVAEAELVQAGVAELIRLQAQGYGYIKF